MQLIDENVPLRRGVRQLTADELARVGVNKLNEHNLVLQCQLCRQVWMPSKRPDGTLAPFHWRCPDRCNW